MRLDAANLPGVVGLTASRRLAIKKHKIVRKSGDPGLIFIDRINQSTANPVPALGPIESTNPCVTGDTLVSTDRGLVRIEDLSTQRDNIKIVLRYSQIIKK